jgi:hypothetical protein
MGRLYVAVAVVTAVGTSLLPAAEAKVRASLSLQPSPPVAGHVVRVTMRTEVLPSSTKGMAFIAVGPWRDGTGQGVRNRSLTRTSSRSYQGSIRFPYAGQWHIQVQNRVGVTFVERQVRVRPGRDS